MFCIVKRVSIINIASGSWHIKDSKNLRGNFVLPRVLVTSLDQETESRRICEKWFSRDSAVYGSLAPHFANRGPLKRPSSAPETMSLPRHFLALILAVMS